MTDKEILDEVYRRLKGDDPHGYKTNPLKDGVRSFIEREWQKRDEASVWAEEKDKPDLEQIAEPDASTSNGRPVKTWCIDAREMERHRGLEIGPDGTVTGIKGKFEPTLTGDFGPVGD
ncbi:hypothetical protein CMI37_13490 [Candidatus Pacearchaeota archaeon]|nr:hypothetical protein [Candidatus Pacearchaeota archaeon]|tara:strand:+ start:2278 stop:2631 length:354 start_codon:yes stop_codon:yes gene_type:complete